MNLTQLLVLVTFLVVLITYDRNKPQQSILLAILSVSLVSEIACIILLWKKENISLVYSLNALLHHSLWLLMLFHISKRRIAAYCLLSIFVTYTLVNLISFEGYKSFNYSTFIFGSFLYLVCFIWESFYRLKREDFEFFLSNNYLLLLAPVLFFLGLSIIFGFKSRELSSTVIFGDVKLYTFIGYFVNIVYYGMINFYIYREKILKK